MNFCCNNSKIAILHYDWFHRAVTIDITNIIKNIDDLYQSHACAHVHEQKLAAQLLVCIRIDGHCR